MTSLSCDASCPGAQELSLQTEDAGERHGNQQGGCKAEGHVCAVVQSGAGGIRVFVSQHLGQHLGQHVGLHLV